MSDGSTTSLAQRLVSRGERRQQVARRPLQRVVDAPDRALGSRVANRVHARFDDATWGRGRKLRSRSDMMFRPYSSVYAWSGDGVSYVRRDMPEVRTLALDITLTLTLDITSTLSLDLTLNIILTFTLSLTSPRLRRRCRTGSTRCDSASPASKGARASSCWTRTACPWMTRTPTGPSWARTWTSSSGSTTAAR